ncbi:hypothetical protein FRC17_003905 [Serendipita sp. 399]|nr:hypothetical protein FRC17_003905 [Serendipita sp. 399]
MSAEEIEEEVQYRASMTFKIDNEPSVTYTLYTNPVFVTPPSCQGGPHKIHLRELPKFQRNVWNVEDLKAAEPVDYEDNGVMVINATGKGAETLARAWCSERGKSAIIRAHGGPCFSCAYHVASGKGLGINLLIWVSSSSDRHGRNIRSSRLQDGIGAVHKLESSTLAAPLVSIYI